MNGKISPTDLAKIFGVSRQYIYASGRNEWTVQDISDYAVQIVEDAENEADRIRARLSEYQKMKVAESRLNEMASPTNVASMAASPTEW